MLSLIKKNFILIIIFYCIFTISSYGAGSGAGGECSTPGIISLAGLCNDAEIKKKINLNDQSNVLLFGCEGDADEELYQKLLN